MTVVLVVYPATGPGSSSPTRVAEIYYSQTCSRSDTITTSGCNVFLFYCQQTTVWLPNEHLASVPNGRGLPDFDSTHSSFCAAAVLDGLNSVSYCRVYLCFSWKLSVLVAKGPRK